MESLVPPSYFALWSLVVSTVPGFQVELPSAVKPKVFKTIGRCIYCGRKGHAERLTREHVIPKGLNGSLIFLGASCEACRVTTARFEEEVLRSEYKIIGLWLSDR